MSYMVGPNVGDGLGICDRTVMETNGQTDEATSCLAKPDY